MAVVVLSLAFFVYSRCPKNVEYNLWTQWVQSKRSLKEHLQETALYNHTGELLKKAVRQTDTLKERETDRSRLSVGR